MYIVTYGYPRKGARPLEQPDIFFAKLTSMYVCTVTINS